MSLSMVKAQTIVLQESFEEGKIPETWSQDYVIGEQSWQVEALADYAYPSGKIPDYKLDGGGTHRAYLRNSSGQTIGYKTKLITPPMDLTNVYRPILRFYYAQDKWAGDVDTLRVYYRTDPEEDWLLLSDVETGNLAVYDKTQRNWKAESFELPNFYHKAYQLAFEGSDNMGRGIVLDSIVVRSYPECTKPYDISLTNVTNGNATIGWHASWDADQFHIVVTNREAEMDTLGLIESAIIAFDTIVEYTGVFSVTAHNLKPDITYYVYIQSICAGQVSDWSEAVTFRMSFREEIPYTETFDIPYISNQVKDQQKESWTWGGDIEPVIPLWIGESLYYLYSRIPDPAVAFNGNYSSSSGRFNTPVPAGSLSYVATPELVGENLKDCQVRFWATLAQRFFRHYAHSIIVGVATDPADYTTFVPVDTVSIWKKDAIEEYTVSLENYVGDGKYVVFVSYFDKPNQFYIDEVTIEKRPEFQKPDYQTFAIIPGTETAQIKWAIPSANVKSYNVKVNKISINNDNSIVVGAEVYNGICTTPQIEITGLQPWDKDGYQVSVQAVYANGTSKWSEPRQFYTSAKMQVPMFFGFEDSEGFYTTKGDASKHYPNNVMIYSTDAEEPYAYAATSSVAAREGSRMLYLSMDAGMNSYVVFPMVDDIQDKQLTFYLTSQTAANKVKSRIEVGVLTEPANIHTFVKTDEFFGNERWTRCYTNFANYTGEGKYIAIRWMEPEGQVSSINYIDNVTIENLVDCPIPSGINYTQMTDTSAVISWTKADAKVWNVKVSSVMYDEAELTPEDSPIADIFDGLVYDNPTISVSGLDYATQYYVYIQADCDAHRTEWANSRFRTECRDVVSVPYVQTFSGKKEGGTGSGFYPACWTIEGYKSYLYSSYDSDGEGGCLYLRTNSATEIGWAALPEINIPIQEAVVTFDIRSATSLNATGVYVGVMTDPYDYSTFEIVDSLFPTTTSVWYYDHKTNFLNYTGDGKYIAFTGGPLRGNTFMLTYLDNVRVNSIVCAAPDVEFTDASSSSLTLRWTGKLSDNATGWQYVVTTKEIEHLEDIEDEGFMSSPGLLVKRGITQADSVVISDLETQTTYYGYVRGLCGDSVWVSVSGMTECATIPAQGRYIQDFESFGKTVVATLSSTATNAMSYYLNAKLPECWTGGTYLNTTVGYSANPDDATTYTLRGYYPFVFSNGSSTEANYYDKGTALTTTHYSNSGTNGIKLYGYYSATASSNHSPTWLAMPAMEADDAVFRSLTVKGTFQMATTAAYRLIIGVMDDPTDLSTFTVLDSIGPGLGTGVGKDVPFEVSLENYTGSGRYIAFRTPYGITTTVYLDDIIVDATGCKTPQPTLSSLTHSSVRLTAGLRGQTDWQYILTDKQPASSALEVSAGESLTKQVAMQVISKIDTVWTDGDKPEISRIDTTYATEQVTVLSKDTTIRVFATEVLPYATRLKVLTGLDESTTYFVSVAAVCDKENNVMSDYYTTSFTTLCKPVSSLYEDFEGFETGSGKQVGCWITGSMTPTATAAYIPYVNNTASYRTVGEKYLYLYTNTTNQGAYAIAPAFDVEDITKYQVVFYARSATTAAYAKKLKVGLVTDPLDLSTMVILDTVDITTTGAKHAVSFMNYKGDLNGEFGKHLVFYSEFNATNQIGIGSVEIVELPSCLVPSSIVLDNLSYNEATLSWLGNSTKYEVVLTSEAVADTTLNKGLDIDEVKSILLLDTIVSENKITLRNLNAATNYYLHVRAICGTDTTEFDYSGKAFTTECAPNIKLPYLIDFENMPTGSGQRPLCWMGAYTTGGTLNNSYPYVYNSSTYAHSGVNTVYMYASATARTTLVSPVIDIADLSQVQLTFWARGAGADKSLLIGVVPDSIVELGEVEELHTYFVELTRITTDASYSTQTQFVINFDEFDKSLFEGCSRIAFQNDMVASGSFYLDDISIQKIPSCFTPGAPRQTAKDFNSVEISFTPGREGDTKWEVAYWEKGTTDTLYQTVDTLACTITGLKESTEYRVVVRTLCGDDDMSSWSEICNAQTEYRIGNYKWKFSGDEAAVLVEGSTSYYLHPALTPGSNHATDSYLYKPQRYLNTVNYNYGIEEKFVAGDDSKTDGALRLYTAAVADTAYVIFPEIINPETRQLTFDVRPAHSYRSDYSSEQYKNILTATYSITEKPLVVVGTIEDGKGLETFETLYEMQVTENTASYSAPTYALASNNYWFENVTMPLPELNGKRLVLASVFVSPSTLSSNNYAYIDNLTISDKTGIITPQIGSRSVLDTVATITRAEGVGAWDLVLLDSAVHFTAMEGHIMRKITNIVDNEVTISGLDEMTDYYVYIANAGNWTLGNVSSRIKIHTACSPQDAATVVYDFEGIQTISYTYNSEGGSSTTYYYPGECYKIGQSTHSLNGTYYSYFPRLITNTASYIYARSGDSCVGFSTSTTAAYQQAYLVMPYTDYSAFGSLDSTEMTFYMRLGYAAKADGKMSASNSVSYTRSLVVGMVKDPEDFFGTFTPIDTVYYKFETDELTSASYVTGNPDGWWDKKVVALKSGLGDYVAFYQPGYQYSQYIDDVVFQKRQSVLAPSALRAEATATTATLNWYAKQEIVANQKNFQFQLAKDAKYTTILMDTLLENDVIKLSDLEPNTQYFWRVKQINTKFGDSEYTKSYFFTECLPISGDFSTSFEQNESEQYRLTTTSTMLQNSCWEYNNAGTSTTVGTSYPYNIPSTSTVSYSLDGDYALKLYAYSTTFSGYVVTPQVVDADMDNMQVSFWMTPCPHGINTNTNRDKVTTAWASGNAAQVEVGTCTDPYDVNTFVALDTVKYSRYMVSELTAGATASAANDYTFQKIVVPLTGAVGQYVYIRAIFDKLPNVGQTAATTQSTVYIDKFAFEPLQVCPAVTGVSLTDKTDKMLSISWQEGEDAAYYVVQVATDVQFNNVLVSDTVEVANHTVEGLEKATNYYVRVQQECSEDGTSEWSQVEVFRTSDAPMYFEQFRSTGTLLSSGWSFADGVAKDIFEGAAELTYKTSLPGNTTGWYAANENDALSGTHVACRTYYYSTTSYAKWWMISPTIILNETEDAMLSFMMNYTWYNSSWSSDKTWYSITHSKAGGMGLSGVDDQFMVIVSDDGGQTWKRENATIWNNETSNDTHSADYYYGIGDYSMNGIKFLGNDVSIDDMIRIDLSKYKGKSIRIAFYMESKVKNTDNVIHIDNVHVNYVTTLTEQNNICQFEDYESEMKAENNIDPLFSVDGDNLPAGLYTESVYTMSVENGVNDTVRTLELTVLEAPQIDLGADTICEGDTYSNYGFTNLQNQGVFKRKGISEVTGCDQIETFYLHVTPRIRVNVEDTICQGQSYNFNGTILNRSGLYVDTLTSFVTGCDSIINLVLFVRQPQGETQKVTICHGETYQLGDTLITTTGLYTHHFTTAAGCDSIVMVDLTVLPELTDTIYDYFCMGSRYQQNGFDVSTPGIYRQQNTSAYGCDSLTVLILDYYTSDTLRITHTITTNELPFTYESLYYGENTLPGTYVDTITVNGDGCDAIVIHTLIVQVGSGLDDIIGSELRLAPSVINKGETVSVVGRFTPQQLDNMTIDIYDMTGKRVGTLYPTMQPIVIGGFYQTGIYNIRITAGDNTTYTGRVMVK